MNNYRYAQRHLLLDITPLKGREISADIQPNNQGMAIPSAQANKNVTYLHNPSGFRLDM